jgi:hypothetical protein
MNYKKLNNITGWAVFAIALIVYTLTMEVNGSLWDCGEFAGTAARLGVPHPPGAPLFLLITRIFAFLGKTFGFGETAGMVFGAGALVSALTILFLFWTITHFAKKIVTNEQNSEELNSTSIIAILASGVVGALAFTFSDSFWYSAVETEVYAMSSLCTAVVFWAALKWEDHPLNNEAAGKEGQNQADKWMVLVFFIMGMSIGIHLLNILTIPPIILLYYYKRHKVSTKGTWIALFISILILGFVQKAVGQWSISLAFPFDKFFVNSFGLPPITGFVFFFILLGIAFNYALKYANNNGKSTLRLGLWCLIFTLIGMSTYMTTMFRAKAKPGINMYAVTNPYALNGYLSREQYGDFPLLYGQTYEANQIGGEYTGDKYVLSKDENGKLKYKKSGKNYKPEFSKEDMMLLPRIWYSSEKNRKDFYSKWLNTSKEIVKVDRVPNEATSRYEFEQTVVEVSDEDEITLDRKLQGMNQQAQALNAQAQKNGGTITEYRLRDHLTQKENIDWLLTYQINWMYLRYFMWNFAGKQNDIQGFGNKRDGNWISGISFIDNMRLGNQNAMPSSLKANKANNKLYFLPLILGIFGALIQFKRTKRDGYVTGLLFLMTGLAIVGYLNQYGLQPRERDYAYVGSFYAFAIWIGLGVLQIRSWLAKLASGVVPTYAAAALSFVAVPLLMANVEWDDHDRSKKSTAIDLAKSYLNSCPKNAMLFTIGDNDTYPLWYAQEVHGIRPDIRVVNTSLLGIDWYLDQLSYKVNESAPFKAIWKQSDYEGSRLDVMYEEDKTDNNTLYSLKDLLTKCINAGDAERPVLPARRYYIDVDVAKAQSIFNLAAGDSLAARIETGLSQEMRYVSKGDLGILNVIAANINERPICFTDDNGANLDQLGLVQFFRKEGMVYRFMPSNTILAKNTNGLRGNSKVVELDESYKRMMEKDLFGFGNTKTKGVYFDEENRRHLESIRSCYAIYAQEMNAAGRKKEAADLVKKIHTEMPGYGLPYGLPSRYDNLVQTSLTLANAAKESGETAIAKEILESVNKEEYEQMQYYYKLSNPSKEASKANVEAYLKDFEEVTKLFKGGISMDEATKITKIQNEKIVTGKLDQSLMQELFFSYRNYKSGLEALNNLNNPPATTTAAAPATGSTTTKVKDTQKR